MQKSLHYIKVKHRTCASATGRRRSPVAGPSYDAGIALLDETTGRTTNRQHTDGTEILFTEIFSAENDCFYSDKSIPLETRLNRLWNDLYKLNKSNSERIAVYGEIALPNDISDTEAVELTNKIGKHMAIRYKRNFQLSTHKKKGNLHIHFSGSEREFKNGKFLQKRQKFYLDTKGNLILDKNYKDSNGWDIRKPIIDNDKVPAGKNPYERDKSNGNYLYQKLGERNRKLWASDTSTGKFLEKDQLSELHDSIDKIVNEFLHEHNYSITVRRNRREVTEILKENNATTKRIPTKDYKINSERAKEIKKQNERNNALKEALTKNLIKSELAELNMKKADKDKKEAEKAEEIAIKEQKEAEKELMKAGLECWKAVSEYNKALEAEKNLAKKFSFTGTEQEKRKTFAKKYNNLHSCTSDEILEFQNAVYKERDNSKENIINAVLGKLTQEDYKNIYKVATKKDMENENYAKSFLSRKKDVLEKFASRYGEKAKFEIYDWWSKTSQVLYKKIHTDKTKTNQKAVQQAHTDQQIDGR